MNTRRSIKTSFSKAADSYDAAAFMQQEIARRLDERMDMMKITPASILDAGCGTGFSFPLLRRRYPDAKLIGLDLAHPMLLQARQRAEATQPMKRLLSKMLGRETRLPLVCADFEQLPLAADSVDLVWSNVALQWAGDLETVFRQFHRVLRPGGLLLFSTFGPDTLMELRAAFQDLDGYNHVNRFLDMHDIGDMLVHAGFSHPVMEMEHLTLTYADLKSLLRELKSIGAQTVTDGRRRGLMGKQAWQRFTDNYERFRREGRLPATYEIVYGHAWVGDKRIQEDGRQVIQWKIGQRRAGVR